MIRSMGKGLAKWQTWRTARAPSLHLGFVGPFPSSIIDTPDPAEFLKGFLLQDGRDHVVARVVELY